MASGKNAIENNNFATSVIIKPTIKVCFEMQACKKQVVDRIINIARLSGVVLNESDININTIESYIDIFNIPDITDLIIPSSLGSPVTIRGVDVLVKNGVDIAEAEAFLNSLSFEQRRLMDLATSDLMGNKFYEEAVLKTFEEYYPEYQKKKSSNKNTDTDNALTGSTSGTASGGAMPPDDDKDKSKNNLSNKDNKKGAGGNGAASDLPNLDGMSPDEARKLLEKYGFDGKSTSSSGWQRFKGKDGSRINSGQRLDANGNEIPRNMLHDTHPTETIKLK